MNTPFLARLFFISFFPPPLNPNHTSSFGEQLLPPPISLKYHSIACATSECSFDNIFPTLKFSRFSKCRRLVLLIPFFATSSFLFLFRFLPLRFFSLPFFSSPLLWLLSSFVKKESNIVSWKNTGKIRWISVGRVFVKIRKFRLRGCGWVRREALVSGVALKWRNA